MTVPVSLLEGVLYQLCDKEQCLGVGSSGSGGCRVSSTLTVKAVSRRTKHRNHLDEYSPHVGRQVMVS